MVQQCQLTLTAHQYEALDQAEVLVLVTEWNPFRNPDFHLMKKMMLGNHIIDGRNLYDPAYLHRHGFTYQGVGRKGSPVFSEENQHNLQQVSASVA